MFDLLKGASLTKLFVKKAAPTFVLNGVDARNYDQARAISGDDEGPVSHSEMIVDSLRLYEHYLDIKQAGGKYFRRWDGTGTFAVIDFPTSANTIPFNLKLSDQSIVRVEAMKNIAGLGSVSDVFVHACRMHSTMVIETYHGWKHFSFSPGGPDGGEPIFETDSNDFTQGNNIVRLSEWVRPKDAAAASHKDGIQFLKL